MGSLVFATYALAYVGLGALLLGLLRQDRWRFSLSALLLCVLVPSLVYENAVLALGAAIGEGATLEALNRARFVLHAALGGALALFAVDLGRRAGISWLSPAVLGLAGGAAALMAYLGAPHYARVPMEAVEFAGVVRYVSTVSSPLGPFPILFGTLTCLVAGAMLWRRLANPALAIGAAAVLVGHAGPSQLTFFLGNLSEIVFAAGLLLVERQLRSARWHDSARSVQPRATV
jgi:hypothetical protein